MDNIRMSRLTPNYHIRMKKILYILFVMLCMASCNDLIVEKRTYEVNYTVCYPDTSLTKTDTMSCTCGMTVWNNREPVRTSSHRGTNYIIVGNNDYVNTTCQIRVNKYKRLK